MLKRKAETLLDEWKNSRDALLITGARQVGKSYLVRNYGTTHFKRFIEINLYEHKDWITIFAQAKNAVDLIFRISSFTKEELIEGDTLIFFDEIQYAKDCDLITLAKFLVEDGRYRYIFSGSLLGVELNNVVSWPVGYMREIRMFPLDFEEFLVALGLKQNVIDYLKECFEKEKIVDALIHERLMDAFYKYLLIGGMPKAVETYILTNDLKKVNSVQNEINQFYLKDITQYAPVEEKIHIETMYNQIPEELNSKNKRFSLNTIGQGYEIRNVQDDFMWLRKAGVALPVFNIDEPKVPLALSANNRLVKLFHADIGILAYLLMDTDIQMKILAKAKDINYGAIFENFVAQELTAHSYENMYYFNSKKQGEVDFIISYHGNVLPIEVKSGKDYKYHSALSNILTNPNYDIPQAIVLCNDNIERKEKVLYLPIYMVMFLKRVEPVNVKINCDLSDLTI